MAMKQLMRYLKLHVKRNIIYDTTILDISEYNIKQLKWFQCYPNVKE